MSDERLLSEALRAQAAGGVSTPRADTPAPPAGPPGTDTGADGPPPSGRRRFRPLGRVRHPQQADQAPTEQTQAEQQATDRSRPAPSDQPASPAARPDVPAPRSGGPGRPPPGYARGPVSPGLPTAPVRQGPTSGGFGVAGGPVRGPGPRPPGGAHPAPAGAGTSAGYVPWSAVTVTWWSLVAVLAGGVVGGAVGVLSLLLPA